ncbi:uncharacterized protein LOC136767936 [Amia ocellicauda]|uniref:uncharacterized protein LOC136767936 n=1 Tax=Amia ocellicauda TaxID=2972642 RepID=UPI003464926E
MAPVVLPASQPVSVVPVADLALPLPAIVMIAVCAYLLVLLAALWCRQCLKAQGLCPLCCQCSKGALCGDCEYCMACVESCDCKVPSVRVCLDNACPGPTGQCCAKWDCACTCQPPECQSFNCLCFEIKLR